MVSYLCYFSSGIWTESKILICRVGKAVCLHSLIPESVIHKSGQICTASTVQPALFAPTGISAELVRAALPFRSAPDSSRERGKAFAWQSRELASLVLARRFHSLCRLSFLAGVWTGVRGSSAAGGRRDVHGVRPTSGHRTGSRAAQTMETQRTEAQLKAHRYCSMAEPCRRRPSSECSGPCRVRLRVFESV